jgi:hypothetical protein
MQIFSIPRSTDRRLVPLPRRLGWTRSSLWLLSAFLAIIGLILIVWWPLVVDYHIDLRPSLSLWAQIDWLLIGVFAVMSF